MTIDPHVSPSQILSISPSPTKEDEFGLHWTFEDFEPNEDIRISYLAYDAETRIRYFQAAILNAKGDRPVHWALHTVSERVIARALSDMYVCAFLIDDYDSALMACDWALEIERETGNLPNFIVGERNEWGKMNGNLRGNDIPWEVARAVALIRLGRIEEMKEYAENTVIIEIEKFIADHTDNNTWFYRDYIEREIDPDNQGLGFPDPRSLKSMHSEIRALAKH
jgi:hypothetical protein